MAVEDSPKDYIDSVEFPRSIELSPIGMVRSPHRERHGTPHQAPLPADPANRSDERACIQLFPERVPASVLQDLDGFEYVWVIAWLHLNRGFNPLVAPPREPGKKRGLFATRAPHRPNPVGLSAARLVGIEGHRIWLERIDLLDTTPVLDLKPYVPYADAFPAAAAGWVDEVAKRASESQA
ncbi:MAG: tRNA (N6-threonylcarbamoyladenosine(37)-N6)-methyltransferase TrmO [Myxococcales bacterium]|nr:tRNA (N6-threonylcarbamoyladenosine(37)-N6)-methyltransferase TrmO [Myxococcales bacterium]